MEYEKEQINQISPIVLVLAFQKNYLNRWTVPFESISLTHIGTLTSTINELTMKDIGVGTGGGSIGRGGGHDTVMENWDWNFFVGMALSHLSYL